MKRFCSPCCLVVLAFLITAGVAKSNPVQIINTNAGRVMTVHTTRYGDKLYIDGLVYRPPSPGIGAHVHVWGTDKDNHRVFFKTTSVLITGKPSFIRSESYVVSVKPSVFSKASSVYVTFHGQSDKESTREE
jgi:3D (Asp-Asp-Asp) domain-containing protein